MAKHIGLVGGGNITETHARAAKHVPGVEIAAIYGTNADNVARLCREYGGKAYSDFTAFLVHRPMDFVALGSPSGLHAEQGIAAVRQGLHVLTEKPIDVCVEKADALIAEAKRAGVRLGVFFQDRVKPDLLRVRKAIERGALGKPILADARVKWYRPKDYYAKSRWRGTKEMDGGGALINQAIHTVDLMLWLFGDVESVQARCRTALHAIAAEDTLVATLVFRNGALGVLQATTSVFPGYPRRVELSGSEGTVIIEQDHVIAADLREAAANDLALKTAGDANPSAFSPVINDVRGREMLIRDFVRAIETGTKPQCDGVEGRRSLAVVEAIYRACAAGECVTVASSTAPAGE
jgi:predicted dehydrogenase